jgi:hypothetical protein
MKSVMRCERIEVSDGNTLEALFVGIAPFTRIKRLTTRVEQDEFQVGQSYRVSIGPIIAIEDQTE